MASLIPSLGSCLRRLTAGERRFARRLENHLEDDYLCWYDVLIGGRDQHPDFIVLHPSRGLLILVYCGLHLARALSKLILVLRYNGTREQPAPQEAEDDGTPLIAPESAGRSGPPPMIVQLPDIHAALVRLAEHLRKLHERGHPWRDMAVLHRRARSGGIIADAFKQAGIPHHWLGPSHHRRHFDPDADTVKILTMHSSKGLEFPVMAIPGLGYMPYEDEDAGQQARVLDVAMTWTMEDLIMTAHRDLRFIRQVSAAVGKVAA